MSKIIDNSRINAYYSKKSKYSSFFESVLKKLKENPDELFNGLFYVVEDNFIFEELKNEFENIKELKLLCIKQNQYADNLFHILRKGKDIPDCFNRDVSRTLSKRDSRFSSLREVIAYWEEIDNSIYKEINNSVYENTDDKITASNRYNKNSSSKIDAKIVPSTSSDGSYGTHIIHEHSTGKFASVPLYDNYGEEGWS